MKIADKSNSIEWMNKIKINNVIAPILFVLLLFTFGLFIRHYSYLKQINKYKYHMKISKHFSSQLMQHRILCRLSHIWNNIIFHMRIIFLLAVNLVCGCFFFNIFCELFAIRLNSCAHICSFKTWRGPNQRCFLLPENKIAFGLYFYLHSPDFLVKYHRYECECLYFGIYAVYVICV